MDATNLPPQPLVDRIQSWMRVVEASSNPSLDDPSHDDPLAKRARYNQTFLSSDTFIYSYNASLNSALMSSTPGTPSKQSADEIDEQHVDKIPNHMGDLEMLEKPILHVKSFFGRTNRAQLPEDIRDVFSLLLSAKNNRGVIPYEVREEVISLEGDIAASPGTFRKAATAGAQSTLPRLRSILEQAQSAHIDGYGVEGWNHLVHTPMLTTVFPSCPQRDPESVPQDPRARVVPAMGATIDNNKDIKDNKNNRWRSKEPQPFERDEELGEMLGFMRFK
ncbi:hypothetical protein F5Y12DRAFT_717414 [Xylaria sp. FL1777]|nr:hypothetical protein F5Y12DRAFT_717414 [Xylaria sp. FL1777]